MSGNTNAPWRDAELLRKKYWVEGKSLSETADVLGCSAQTVANWLERHELGVRNQPGNSNADYRDKNVLEELYIERGLSTIEMADELGCSKQTVQKWLKRNGIETRPSNHDKPLKLHTNKSGYEYFSGYSSGQSFTAMHHRLLAVSEGKLPPEDFANRNINIHHKDPTAKGRSGIPWDNRPEVIEVLTVAKHGKEHDPARDKDELGRYA